jgi:hypothetical protein
MNYFLIAFLSLIFISNASADFEVKFKAEQKVLKLEKKYTQKCKKVYKRASLETAYYSEFDAIETVKYIDCIKEYLTMEIHSRVKNKMQFEENLSLLNKIEFYTQQKNDIQDKIISQEEKTIERQIIISSVEKEKVDLKSEKILTLAQAKQKCFKKGFKERSSDPLERFLFKQCVEEEGFILEDSNYSNVANLKKEKELKSNSKKQQINEEKRKQELDKKKKNDLSAKPSQPKLKPTEISTLETKNPIVKEEPKLETPITSRKSTNKIVCKVDENKNKICIYDPSL